MIKRNNYIKAQCRMERLNRFKCISVRKFMGWVIMDDDYDDIWVR
jgi:hypothetical protein